MAKYIFPTAAVSAVYSVWRGFTTTDDVPKIRTVEEAIVCLNENKNTTEAIRFISMFQYDASPAVVGQLTIRSLGILAGIGSNIVKYADVKPCEAEDDDFNFQKALQKFHLGDEWDSTVAWLGRITCSEDDLACDGEWLIHRPSEVDRLFRLLQILFLKTEQGFSSDTIGENIVDFLYLVFTDFQYENKELALQALKTLSNVVLNGTVYAERIFKTEWLPLLAHLVGHAETLDVRLLSHKICQNALHTLGIVPYSLSSNVYELYHSEAEPLVDIVMVHGLRGSVAHTWRQKDGSSRVISECWPKDWLPLDIKEPMRILGIDYPSYLVQFTGTMESISVRADRFRKQLNAAGLGSRPIVFICHSMGGLLAKRMLLDSPKWRNMTVGVLFLATPHRGSPIADWGYSILHPSEDVRFLNEKNKINKKLNEDFAEISEEIPVIVSMVETKESNLIGTAKGLIVPVESAVFGKGALYHIEEVHHNVCKPSERGSPSYGVIINFLKDSINEAKKMLKE